MKLTPELQKINLPNEIVELLEACPKYTVANDVKELAELSYADAGKDGWQNVDYDVPGKGAVTEAKVCRVNNGVAANYLEPYMRRRDPNCLLIADGLPTDKQTFKDRFGKEFDGIRKETFEWLKKQELALFFFRAGPDNVDMDSVAIAPANAAFFSFGLSLLQGIVDIREMDKDFSPDHIIYVAPPFRHTHFDGKQIVVHNRQPDKYEMFSYNLYPGPSAKKGVYGMLINKGESEEWLTLHCSTVQVITPYDNRITIVHEGASGGGKSEMLEDMHRERSGRITLGKNLVTEDTRQLTLPQGCSLRPVTDDMAVSGLYHSNNGNSKNNGKLSIDDAEDAWFIRVNHITEYGTHPHLEKISCKPTEPLLFLNIEAKPDSTALIWEHIKDAPDKVCPNPRVVLPRRIVPDVIKKPVCVDIRSFGVRAPPCTKENPSYGIFGFFHVLPPALAWLWRLVAPRGYGNPSIVDKGGMSSEGVGSYWPFATGKKVRQANLLLRQIMDTPKVKYILTPNQHVGAWKVGFMPQWLTREYLARRGGAWFRKDQLAPARCPLLGYSVKNVMIEGSILDKEFLQVDKQPEVGEKAYDAGSKQLSDFFKDMLKQYLGPELHPLGKKIIECCLNDGKLEDYMGFIDSDPIIVED
jgi:hypothetical protein